MKVYVINGSSRGENSDTLKLTKAFLKGMGVEDYETVHTIVNQVKPCLGCHNCWWKTPGKCIYQDGMEEVLQKIMEADLVILSFPLYCYSMPSTMKAYIDRLMPLSTPVQEVDEQGRTCHRERDRHTTKFMMISGCGFPNIEGNYDGMLFAFDKMFGESEKIVCVEAPMFSSSEAEPLTSKYLLNMEQAGKEYATDGRISEELHKVLDTPMLDPDTYRAICSGNQG